MDSRSEKSTLFRCAAVDAFIPISCQTENRQITQRRVDRHSLFGTKNPLSASLQIKMAYSTITGLRESVVSVQAERYSMFQWESENCSGVAILGTLSTD